MADTHIDSVTPSIAETERIVAVDDPVLRNLLITQAYHELSDGTLRLLGRSDAVWVSVACWSSKSVGRFIRLDDLPDAFMRVVKRSTGLQKHIEWIKDGLRTIHPGAVIDPVDVVLRAAERVMASASGYLALGNRVVFAELGTLFARFVETFAGDTSADESKLERFLDLLPDGPPEADAVTGDALAGTLASSERGGKTLLRKAVTCYYRARFTADPKARAELVLLGNALGGIHEQTRLQPYIAGSLDAAGNDLLYNSCHDALVQKVVDRALFGTARAVLDKLLRPMSVEFERVFREFATAELMKLKLPDGEIRMGRDLLAPAGKPLYPAALTTIENPDLVAALERYGALDRPGAPAGRGLLESAAARAQGLLDDLGLGSERAGGSRAHDWADLDQRMRYILPLFRSRAHDEGLFGPPFTEIQRAALRAGQIPSGALY